MTPTIRNQIPNVLKLAVPVAVAQLGQMFMGVVDTVMVGKLGPSSIASVGLGTAIFWIVALSSLGLLSGLDHLVSVSFGKRDLAACQSWLIQGAWIALLSSVPLAIITFFISINLEKLGVTRDLADQTGYFLSAFCWSIIPFSLFAAFRQYLQALNHVKFITIIVIVGNAFNAFLNWVFIYGHLGFHAHGVSGSGIATVITRSLLSLFLAIYTVQLNKGQDLRWHRNLWAIDFRKLKRLMKFGFPSAGQLILEVGFFSLATILASRLGAVPLAAHSIVLNIASFMFMIPLGVSIAGAVLVGQALGENNLERMRKVGDACFVIGVGFMGFSSILLFFEAEHILRIFSQNIEVIKIGKSIIFLAAIFQLADGTQVVGTGTLRGLGETKLPMFSNLIGHWFFGLPVAIYLCFYKNLGIYGIWLGLTVGLILVGGFILRSWISHSRKTQFQKH